MSSCVAAAGEEREVGASSTTWPGVIGMEPVIETQAASTRHPTASSCRLDPRQRREPAVEHVELEARAAHALGAVARRGSRAVSSRPCARVMGMSVAISPTRRGELLDLAAERPRCGPRATGCRIDRSSTASGIGERVDRQERGHGDRGHDDRADDAPWSPTAADGSICCSISSTFSTSRTTLVCTIDEFAREWNPIDRLCSRAASALRRSAPIVAHRAHEEPRVQHVVRVVLQRARRARRPPRARAS